MGYLGNQEQLKELEVIKSMLISFNDPRWTGQLTPNHICSLRGKRVIRLTHRNPSVLPISQARVLLGRDCGISQIEELPHWLSNTQQEHKVCWPCMVLWESPGIPPLEWVERQNCNPRIASAHSGEWPAKAAVLSSSCTLKWPEEL